MKKYYGLDWIRTIACIGIMAMHVAAHNKYEIDGFIYKQLIHSFTDFVYLFMAVSAFGMCCGYYDKVLSGKVNWSDFYKKRYRKILPFFAFLIVIDIVRNFNISSICEGFAEITLLHGFIPSEMTTIGAGWFLGTVFIFYLIFPFFCALIKNKYSAWCAFGISIILNFICANYFNLIRHNFLYSFCYFIIGGLVYQYKDKLKKVKWYFSVPSVLLSLLCYYIIGANTLTRIFVTASLLIFAVSIDFKNIKAISFISDISMEFYLSHMALYRLIEKVHLNTVFGNGWGQYLISITLVFGSTLVFSFCVQKLIDKVFALLARVKR